MLHHRWQEAAQYLDVYTQTLEDTTISKQLSACGVSDPEISPTLFTRDGVNHMYIYFSQIIWRLGTEVLQHHPNAELEHFNVLYERMKNTGVKNYAKVRFFYLLCICCIYVFFFFREP